MSGVTVGMVDPWGQIVRERAAKGITRKSVAMTYAFGLRQDINDTAGIKAANEAIVARWSPAALNWIKERAWAYAEGRREFGT